MKTLGKRIFFTLLFLITPVLVFSQTITTSTQENQKNLEEQLSMDTPEYDNIIKDIKIPTGHEIYLGYGYPNSLGTVFSNGFVNIVAIIFTGGLETLKVKGPGAAQIGYNYIFQNGFSVGGIFTYEPYNLYYINNKEQTENKKEFQSLFSIQAKAAYQYGWKYVRLYHGLSLGLAIMADFTAKSATPLFDFNLIPIGIKVGPEQGFNFYADVGLWSTPLVNAGVTYRF